MVVKKIIPTNKKINTNFKLYDEFSDTDGSSGECSSNKTSDENNSIENETNHCSIDLSKPHIEREQIELIAGRKVNDVFYYQRALTHKSIQGLIKYFDGEPQEYMKESNERLEFLGDSYFGTIITTYLFKKYPNKDEGFLTKVRTRIVKGTAMAKFAEHIGIKDNILMSQYVINAGGRNNKRFLEDAFEAFVGAMFLDLGFEEVKKFSLEIIEKYTNEKEILYDDNFKDLLIRFCQFKKLNPPEFITVKEEGPSHKKMFTIHVKMYDKIYGKGVANKKKKAEQTASQQAVKILGITEDSFNLN